MKISNNTVLVAEDLLAALGTDTFEIRVGRTEDVYHLYLSSPEQAFEALNPEAQLA